MKHSSPFPYYLAERFRAWRASRFDQDQAWYARLAQHGQTPRTMLIACCDSRVDPLQMFGGEPGDFFVVRNVANLVPPSRPDRAHHGTSAAVEFAVKHLKVAHIVVLGHSGCGGVEACYNLCHSDAHIHPEAGHVSYIDNWLELLRPAAEKLVGDTGERTGQLRQLEHSAVLTSLENLHTFDFVAQAVAEKKLTLHGAWIDIGAGELRTFNPKESSFQPL